MPKEIWCAIAGVGIFLAGILFAIGWRIVNDILRWRAMRWMRAARDATAPRRGSWRPRIVRDPFPVDANGNGNGPPKAS